MAPFDTTVIVPDGWSKHHQPAATTAMRGRALITDPNRTSPGEWDPVEGVYGPDTPHIVAGGPQDTRPDWRTGVPCRIQRQRDDRPVTHAAQNITIRLYTVQLPADVPDLEVGYMLHVLVADDDEHLVGEDLEVSDVMHGTERFTRDVAAVHNQAPRHDED